MVTLISLSDVATAASAANRSPQLPLAYGSKDCVTGIAGSDLPFLLSQGSRANAPQTEARV